MGGWFLGFPCTAQPPEQPVQEGQFVHSPTLFTNMVSLRSWGKGMGFSRLGVAVPAPLVPSPQGGSGRSQRCVGPGEPYAPQKRTLHPEESHGRSHNGLSPCKRKQAVAGRMRAAPACARQSACHGAMIVSAGRAETQKVLNMLGGHLMSYWAGGLRGGCT